MRETIANIRSWMIRSTTGEPAQASSSRRRDPVVWLIACGILLIAGIIVGTTAMIGEFRERALANSERELENTVLLLTRHFDQQFDDYQVMANDLLKRLDVSRFESADAFRDAMSGLEAHEKLTANVSALSYLDEVNIYDADGKLINSSGPWPPRAVDVSTRHYFQSFKTDPKSPPFFAEALLSFYTGKWTTVLAHRLTGANGVLLGAMTRRIDPLNYEKFFASVALGSDAAIAMFHTDGTLLARHPHIERLIGQNMRDGPLLRLMLDGGRPQTLRVKSPIDGEARLAAGGMLHNFPLAFVVTRTVDAALADWREQTRLLVAAATLLASVIAITLYLIIRQIVRQNRDSQQRIEAERRRLDTALNNMIQGLVLYDSSARMVICNRRYIDMYSLSTEVVKPGCHFRDLIQHRKDTGSFNGDVDDYCASVQSSVAEGKISVKIMESDDGHAFEVLNKPLLTGGWVATIEDVTERRKANETIAHLAHYDALTDLPNRVLFRDQIERELRKARKGGQFALLYIDIDEFKGINDSLGHHVGDELLKSVATRLKGCVRPDDLIARLGGDEFAVIRTAITGPADVEAFVTELYDAIRQPYQCLGHQLSSDASIGIALAPQDGTDLDQLVKNADLAMYAAKSGGRRLHRFFESSMDACAKARLSMEQDLRRALLRGGFEIHYQPVVSLGDGEVTGCEALLRWHHPERGMISPAEFVPVAEDTGLINELGDWVLRTACAEAANWPDHIRLAVNVSPVQLKSPTLALRIAGALADSRLAPGRLEIEITEAVLIRDDEAALAILHGLRAIGVRIALDDFGTGYSSLSYLKRFPFDKIKIDRSFVSDITEAAGSSSIVQAVVNIAASLDMTTTAEGVEREGQRELLRALGCTEMQGYLFSAARPGAEVRQFFGTRREVAAATA